MMDWPALKKLAHRQYDGLCQEVQSCLADALNGELLQEVDQKAINSLYNFVMQFLAQCCTMLSADKDPLHPEVMQSIGYCCSGYSWLCQVACVDKDRIVASLKTILFIVSKISGKASLMTLVDISSSVLRILRIVSVAEKGIELSDLISKFYSCIWNAAITLDKEGQIAPAEICRLRILSVNILAWQSSTSESCLEKLSLILTVFGHRSKELSSRKDEERSDERTKHCNILNKKNSKTSKSKAKCTLKAPKNQKHEGELGLEEKISDEHFVFTLVVDLLQEIVQHGEVKTDAFLKVSVALRDFLVSVHHFELLSVLKNKLYLIATELPTNQGNYSATKVLTIFWNFSHLVEHLCEESNHTERMKVDFKTLLTDTLERMEKLTNKCSVETDVASELFQWYLKQMKNKKINTNVFETVDSLKMLLQMVRKIQLYLGKVKEQLVAKADESSLPFSQEKIEKVLKPHLDSYRCWLTLCCRTMAEWSPRDMDLSEIQSQISEQLTAYIKIIDSVTYSPAIEQNERYCLGSLCVKFGHMQYNRNKDDQAIRYYSLACQQLTLWCEADSSHVAARMKEASLLKLYNCLSQSQHKTGKIDDAMETIVKAFSVATKAGEVAVTPLMMTWIKLKKSAAKEGGMEMNSRLARSFGDSPAASMKVIHESLQMELSWLVSGQTKPRLWPVEGAVLNRLRETSSTQKDNDLYQLLLLQFDVLTNSATQATRQELTSHLDSMMSVYPEEMSVQAGVCFTRFCLAVKDKVEKPVEDVPEEKPVEDVPEEGPVADVPVAEKMVGEEEKALVRKAVQYYSLALQDEGCEDTLDTVKTHQRMFFRDMMLMIADILMACREFMLQLEVLVLAKQITGDSANDAKLDIKMGIMDALTSLGVENIPTELIRLILGPENARDGDAPERRMDGVHLSLINFYLKTGQVVKAYPLLNEFRDRLLRKALSCLHAGKLSRLMGECLRLRRPQTFTWEGSYVLTCAQNAYRFHFSLFSRAEETVQPSKHRNGEESLWRVLVELLESILFLGYMYRHIGDAKRSRCYLKEGLILSRKFGLLKWSTLLGLEIAELLLDTESLQPMLDILRTTYTQFIRAEPQSDSSKQPQLSADISMKSRTPLPKSVETCKRVDGREEEEICLTPDRKEDGAGFWQKMRTYQKMTGINNVEMTGVIGDLVAEILSWCRALTAHDPDCCCLMCTDAESQLLAVALTKTCIKVIHSNMMTVLQPEQFFSSVLKAFRKIDQSTQVTNALHSAQLVGISDTISCGDLRHVLCLTELTSLIAKIYIQYQNIPQAVTHAQAGLLALKCVPKHVPAAIMLNSHLTHVHALCLQQTMCTPRQWKLKAGDLKDAWHWLSEDELSAEVQQKLEKLKIMVPADSKNDKAQSGETVNIKDNIDSCGLENDKAQSGETVNIKDNIDSCGLENDKAQSGETVNIKDNIDSCGLESDEAKNESASDSRVREASESLNDWTAPKSISTASAEVKRISSSHCKVNSVSKKTPFQTVAKVTDTKAAQVTEVACSPSPETCTSVRLATANVERSLQTTGRKVRMTKTCLRQPAAQRKKSNIKKSCSVSSSEDVLFNDDSIATRLFCEEALQGKNQFPTLDTPLTGKSQPSKTPGTSVKCAVPFLIQFSDSEDDFKPCTPLMVPRQKVKSKQREIQSEGVDGNECSRCPTVRKVISVKSSQTAENAVKIQRTRNTVLKEIQIEEVDDEQTVVLSSIDNPANAYSGKSCRRAVSTAPKPVSRTRKATENKKSDPVEEITVASDGKIKKKGGRKPKDSEKSSTKLQQSSRVVNTRTCKAKASSLKSMNMIACAPEMETVRGLEKTDETETQKDVFEFAWSDNENEAAQSLTARGKSGCQTRIRRTRGRNVKQVTTKLQTCTPAGRPLHSIPVNSQLVLSTPKLVSDKRSEKLFGTAVKKAHSAEESQDLSTMQKKSAESDTLNLSSVETLRLCDTKNTSNHSTKSQEIEWVSDNCRLVTCAASACVGDQNCGGLPPFRFHHSPANKMCYKESSLTYFCNLVKNADNDNGNAGCLPLADEEPVSFEKLDEVIVNIQASLTESLSMIQHFPHVNVFSENCKALAYIKMDRGEDPWEVAALLGESAAVSLRHQFLAHCQKQIRIKEAKEQSRQAENLKALRTDFNDLLFPWDVQKYKRVVQSIPQGWTVCQFSVLDSPGHCTLLLTRLICDQEPVTVELPGFSDEKGQAIYFDFKDILKASDEAVKIQDRALWWTHRMTLDTRLENVIEGMEKHWLGPWRGMLAGQTSDPDFNSSLSAAANKLTKLLHQWLGHRCPQAKAKQMLELMWYTKDLPTILSSMLKLDGVNENESLLKAIKNDVLDLMPKVKSSDLPVICILDKHLANLPLEQLSVMRDQPITRVPSLSLLHHLLKVHSSSQNKDDASNQTKEGDTSQTVFQRGIEPASVFFVLNPDGDLKHSHDYLQTPFESFQGWQGIAGSMPTSEQYKLALTEYDLFVYCGHGSGGKYFASEELQKIQCRAVPLLFGCGSVKVELHPHLDPEAYFYSYLLAGSPCVLGNLWDVTDRDIDSFSLQFFNLWLKERGEPLPLLASLVQKARSVSRMRWLNGAAPVVYGLPVRLRRPQR